MSEPDFQNPNRMPVITLLDLASLPEISDGDAMEAYTDGLNGEPCGDNRDRAYWHSWRCGAADGRKRPQDRYDRLLASEVARVGLMNLPKRIVELRKIITDRPND